MSRLVPCRRARDPSSTPVTPERLSSARIAEQVRRPRTTLRGRRTCSGLEVPNDRARTPRPIPWCPPRTSPPPTGSAPRLGSLLRRLEVDPRLFGMIVALVVIWVVLRTSGRGHLPHPAQPLEPLGADLRRRRSWPPAWCWSSCRATSTCRSARCSPPSGMAMAILQVEWLPSGSATTTGPGSSPSLAGLAHGGAHRGASTAHRRVRRGAGVHRHPGWAARLARRGLGDGLRAAPSRPWTRLSSYSAAARAATSAGLWTWIVAGRRLRGHRGAGSQRSSPAQKFGFALRPVWVDVALGVVWLRRGARRRIVINSYLMPPPPGPGVRRAAASAARDGDPLRAGEPGAHRDRGRPGHDLHRHPAALRPLRVRHRRQPRGRRARRHQDPLDRS